jgi:hypothetical protein
LDRWMHFNLMSRIIPAINVTSRSLYNSRLLWRTNSLLSAIKPSTIDIY